MGHFAILGATGTIGTALSRNLVRSGNQILLLGRDESKLSLLSQELGQHHRMVDLAHSSSIEQAIENSPFAHSLDGIVNCIGSILLKPAHATSDLEFRNVLEVNLFSAFAAVKAGAKFLGQRGGSVILFSSAAANIGLRNHEAIAAAKAGIEGLVRSAASTYAAKNIRFNAVSLGLVQTALTRSLWQNEITLNASKEMHALGRLGEPAKVASLVSWLLHEDNDWMTGQIVGFDGGLSTIVPRKKSGAT